MSDAVFEAMGRTREFLFERVYLGRITSATRDVVELVVGTLLTHHEGLAAPGAQDPREGAVDYVAGMTDRFALRAFEELAGSRAPGFGALG